MSDGYILYSNKYAEHYWFAMDIHYMAIQHIEIGPVKEIAFFNITDVGFTEFYLGGYNLGRLKVAIFS